MQKKKKKKKFKIKVRGIIYAFVFLFFLFLFGQYLFSLPVTNIYISGNKYLTDQQVIELAGLKDYPSSLSNYAHKIEKRLEKSNYIKEAKVSKKKLTQVYIEILENRPLFFNQSLNKTVLLDKTTTEKRYSLPILVNYIPDIIYDDFINQMSKVKDEVLDKISEIKYDPDDVDDARFLLTMTDLNYVYITLDKFDKINSYNDIVKQFDNKKGILYLNSGGYFDIAD